jgi:hypothetical protein
MAAEQEKEYSYVEVKEEKIVDGDTTITKITKTEKMVNANDVKNMIRDDIHNFDESTIKKKDGVPVEFKEYQWKNYSIFMDINYRKVHKGSVAIAIFGEEFGTELYLKLRSNNINMFDDPESIVSKLYDCANEVFPTARTFSNQKCHNFDRNPNMMRFFNHFCPYTRKMEIKNKIDEDLFNFRADGIVKDHIEEYPEDEEEIVGHLKKRMNEMFEGLLVVESTKRQRTD